MICGCINVTFRTAGDPRAGSCFLVQVHDWSLLLLISTWCTLAQDVQAQAQRRRG